MPNTEKPTTKAEAKRKGTVHKPTKKNTLKPKAGVSTKKKSPTKNNIEGKPVKETTKQNKSNQEKNIEEIKGQKNKEKKESKKIKELIAVANPKDLPISTKKSIAVCRFIKGKTIQKAISDLEEVVKLKKAVPMKGEIPHRKGKGIMSGRFPKRTAEHFIKVLKGLAANASENGLEEPIIIEASANKASRPFGRFGRTLKKRSHLKIIAKDKKEIKKNGGKR